MGTRRLMANVMFFLVFFWTTSLLFTMRCYFHLWRYFFFSSEVWSWWWCWRSFQVNGKTSNLSANYQNWTDLTINLNRLVRESGGLEETRSLAKKHATQASDALSRLLARKWSFKKKVHFKYFRYGESEYKNALVKLPEAVLNRMK